VKYTPLSALTLSLLLTINPSFADNGGAAAGAIAGIETNYIDPAVRAQDDFFRYLNGKWLATVEIPADKASWGSFAKLSDDIQPQLRAIIEEAAKNSAKASNPETQKIGDFYNSFMNEAKLEELGLKPLEAEFARIRALKDKKQFAALIAHFSQIGVSSPFDFGIHQDAKDATKYVADIGQGGLGLPDRDYYLKQDDKRLAEAKAKYQQHIEKMLTLAGHKDAAKKAAQILALETELAKVQWSRVELRDPVKAYNKFPFGKLNQLAKGFDWKLYLDSTGLTGKTDYLIISQPSYIKGMASVVQKQPLDTWKAYFEWQVLRSNASNLSKAFVDENFAFYGTTLNGVTENRPRWKRGVSLVEGSLGEAVGKLYVGQNFPPERKAKMEVLVKNLLRAFDQSVDTLDWMSPATRKEAKDKLSKFTPKIGYPNHWRDYSSVSIKADDLLGNHMRAIRYAYDRDLNKLGKPIDREEWMLSPQTLNAYYNPEMNEIVFPAAILQPPFFDANADDAVNYGAIGAVIGHEISHGFDDSGSQYDGNGNLRNWWTQDDHKNFKAKTKVLVEQYSAFSPLPGYNVNGELTLGENIADNSGLAIAYKAYQISLGGKPAPVIDGMTGEQRFFMGFGQVWRGKMREPAMIARIKTDPHSPGEFRANGTLRNQPGFYEAFKLKEGDKMYLAPAKRVTIW
jgi:predicted metalloendopeptidase